MARTKIKLDLKELKRVMRALNALGLSVYGQNYDRKTNQYHEALSDYHYEDVKALAQSLAKGIEPEFVTLYPFEPARGPGRPKRSKNKKRRR